MAKIKLTWTSAPNGPTVDYRIYQNKDGAGRLHINTVSAGNELSYTTGDLDVGTYAFDVTAVVSGSESNSSNVVTFPIVATTLVGELLS